MSDAMVPRSSSRGPIFLAAALAIAAIGMGGYAVHENGNAKDLAAQNAQVQASLASTNSQIEQLTAKLNALEAPKPMTQPTISHRRRMAKDDPRWKKFQSQIDEQGHQIDATRQDLATTRDSLTNDLTSAKTELSGNIAKTHDELVLLQKKGERNYTEFDIAKSKEFRSAGPLTIRLKKANQKQQYADLQLNVDDRTVTKKHVDLYEPAAFYSQDTEHPIEVVINSITKDRIHGYVSAPKYRRSDLTAMAGTAADSTQPTPSLKSRQKLSLPQ